MTRPLVPVDAQRGDWPRMVADAVNPILAQFDFLIGLASFAASQSIDFLALEGDMNTTGFDGLLLSGDAQVSGADFLLYA